MRFKQSHQSAWLRHMPKVVSYQYSLGHSGQSRFLQSGFVWDDYERRTRDAFCCHGTLSFDHDRPRPSRAARQVARHAGLAQAVGVDNASARQTQRQAHERPR
ncbi:MAG: hypothetical protein ABR549_13715, partial [Mycobacteriales bacterium]